MLESKILINKLACVLNECSVDTACNTPDFILADYLMDCLRSYKIVKDRLESWNSRSSYSRETTQIRNHEKRQTITSGMSDIAGLGLGDYVKS